MNCQDYCIHYEVCRYVSTLRQAFGNIVEIHIGGTNPAWKDFEQLIVDRCHYFKEESTDR